MTEIDRIDFEISKGAKEALDEICLLRGCDYAEAIRRALGTELYICENLQKGNRILVSKRGWFGNKYRELVWDGAPR